VRRVFGDIEIAGIIDLSNLVSQKHLAIRIEIEEILVVAPDEEYPLIVLMGMRVASQCSGLSM